VIADCLLDRTHPPCSPPFPTAVEWWHYRGADDATMCTSFHTCQLHAALPLPPPHSLQLNECSGDRSVSLVGGGEGLAGVAARRGASVCRS